MENVSQVNESVRIPVDLPIHPYLLDHRIEGNIVYPAVEAMQTLANAVKRFWHNVDVTDICRARFDKFLYIDPGASRVPAWIDVTVHENGDIVAALLTKKRSKQLAMTRIKQHAELRFPLLKPDLPEPPIDLISALEGICLEIPPEEIYRYLVPFGPSFQNIRDPLLISEDGAIAWTYAPPVVIGKDSAGLLGSSFPLDASFHAACVWGQRYAGIVAFPMGIQKKVLFKQTKPGETYVSRILPLRAEPGQLAFDIWIYDEGGALYEAACGVHMRDVSAGHMKPPKWVMDRGTEPPLERMRNYCRGISLVELKSILPFAERSLSNCERKRLEGLGETRIRSYLAARLACKRLYRRLRGGDLRTPASDITTICADQTRPCCPLSNHDSPVSCSVSHDNRFGIAAACDDLVGVDVERISERVLKSRHLYMSDSEELLVREAALGEMEVAVRIWTIKEAVAKALDMNLAESWNRVEVCSVGAFESKVQLDGHDFLTAVHDTVGRHLFTLVCTASHSNESSTVFGFGHRPPLSKEGMKKTSLGEEREDSNLGNKSGEINDA